MRKKFPFLKAKTDIQKESEAKSDAQNDLIDVQAESTQAPQRQEESPVNLPDSAPEQPSEDALRPSDYEFNEEEPERKFFKKRKEKEPALVVRFQASPDQGLSNEQVLQRIAEGQTNNQTKKYSKTYKSIFISNICTFFNLMCLLCAIALALSDAPISQYLFVLIFVSNIIIGIYQEIRSKLKIDKLTILTSPIANVIRNGAECEVPIRDIVLDDILLLQTGQQVPADCILIDGIVEVNESLLTGESVPIKKQPGEMLYAGSFVCGGTCTLRVEKVGKHTYINKLTSRAKQYKKPKSEIMSSIHVFIRIIGIMIVPIAIGMFFRNWSSGCNAFLAEQNLDLTQWNVFELAFGLTGSPVPESEAITAAARLVFNNAVQRTVSIVIGMIPSGMLLLTTVALAVGVIRLAQNNTLVQDLYSLEMLARVNVLCLDKTGTITDGRLNVSDVKLINNYTPFTLNDIMGSMLAALPDNNQTSIALQARFGYSAELRSKAILPFNSERKLSAVTFKDVGTFALGAPEFILKPLPPTVEREVKNYAKQGYRVIALAFSVGELQEDVLPEGFKPVALIALADHIREDAFHTIAWFKENDVAVKVISGDNPITVSEVAKRVGIPHAEKYISLEGLSALEIQNIAEEYTVFGRVTPEQKAILVRQIRACGNTVAMTGDGVNDILAMKEADCAISVASGSDAARNVSNLVLMDNNFASMPKIVYEGRRVINNIKNTSSLYIMKTLLTAILACFCLLIGIEYFFTTNNLMLYEIFISAIPSFVLSIQPNTDRIHGKFITGVISRALPGAITMCLAVLSMWFMGSGIFSFAPVEFQSDFKALAFLALTFSGLIMLYRICQPFNVLRSILFLGTFAICLILILTLGNIFYTGFEEIEFAFSEIVYLVAVVLACMPLSSWLIRFFNQFNKDPS